MIGTSSYIEDLNAASIRTVTSFDCEHTLKTRLNFQFYNIQINETISPIRCGIETQVCNEIEGKHTWDQNIFKFQMQLFKQN